MDFFKILSGGIGVSMSNFDRLWAKKFSGWPETELTGLLPLTFLAEGSALTNYRIYGTESGAGVQTESGEPAGYKIPILISDKKPEIYGWHVDPSISDPAQAVTYIGDAVGKTPAAMGASTFSYGDWSNAFFMPKPCMVKNDGTVDYYLDPNDYTKKADGTASDVADASYDGNAMMEWPLIWWKYEAGEAEGEGYFYVSNVKVDNTYNCYCNINCDNQIVEHFYTAIYNGTGTTKLRSISGVALTSANGNGGTTFAEESTRAMANNTTVKTEWYIDVWADRVLINGLLVLMGKSLNTQVVFGRGLDSGSQVAKEAYTTGSLNDKGLFWGSTSSGSYGVKVFGMENWWACAYHRTAGLIGVSNNNYAYKMTWGRYDGTSATGYNTNAAGYKTVGTRPATNYFNKAKFGQFGFLPIVTSSSSSTTYYSDYYNDGAGFALVGGAANAGAYSGAFCVALNGGAGNAHWGIAAALTLKPLANPVTPHTSTYNLYIGDSKLGEDEYLDYGEQKIYKDVSGTLTPTDPPVPFPAISTYQGENTLSSEETVGEVTIKGKIKEAP